VIPLLFCRPPSKPDIDRFRSAGSPVISISLSAHLPASRGAHRYQRGAFPATRSDHSRSDEGDQRKPIFWRGASLHPRRSHCPTRPRCNASGDAVCCSQYEATYRTASGGSGTIRPCRRSDDTAPPPTGRRRARSPCASIAWVSASPPLRPFAVADDIPLAKRLPARFGLRNLLAPTKQAFEHVGRRSWTPCIAWRLWLATKKRG
jgi:hypothetical protein